MTDYNYNPLWGKGAEPLKSKPVMTLLDTIELNKQRFKDKYKNLEVGTDYIYDKKPNHKRKRKEGKKKLNYQDYIRSSKWRLKAFHKKRKIGACETCGSQTNLTVHHLTYKRLGRERHKDLMVVCWDCHKHQHEDKEQANHIRSIIKER